MSRRCQVTGRQPGFGNNVSHSQRHTKRRFDPNVQTKRFWSDAQGRWVKLRVSAKGIKTVDRDGVDAVLARMKAAGEKV